VCGYIDSFIGQYLQFLPPYLQKLFEELGATAVLDAIYELVYYYTPSYFWEEIQGISDGSGVDYMTVIRLHMIPEAVQAACTMVGAWGQSIANTTGTLYQLRALDFMPNGPLQLAPAVIVYHPTQGHNFSILSWTGFIGALSGLSSANVGICEKFWASYNGTKNRYGIPFHFLLRDILQFDSDADDAFTRITNAARTCSIWIGLGDYTNTFKIVAYSVDNVTFWDEHNFPVYTGHPKFPGVLYLNKHEQPSTNACLGDLIQEFYGNLNAQTMISWLAAVSQTGDQHVAVYDYTNMYMYVASSSPYVNGTSIPAYQRKYIMLDMNALWAM